MNLAERLLHKFLEELRSQGHKPTMRMFIHFNDTMPGAHHCTSHREGDLIIWRCPLCPNYERRFNWKTGEMKCVGNEGGIVHVGTSSEQSNMEALTMNMHNN